MKEVPNSAVLVITMPHPRLDKMNELIQWQEGKNKKAPNQYHLLGKRGSSGIGEVKKVLSHP